MPDIRIDRIPHVEHRTLPVFTDLDRMLEQVREVAFGFFARRGYGEGYALDDWLAAEKRVFGADTEVVESVGHYEFSVPLEGFRPTEIGVCATPRELIVTATAIGPSAAPAGSGAPDSPAPGLAETAVFRRIVLPSDIAVEQVSASLKQGRLTVVAPKSCSAARVGEPVAA